ncbi:MAG: ATP-binding protein [Chthoniobacteraceae bacterium]
MKTAGLITADAPALPHPRRIGWLGTTALAMGGSNQSLFLLAALFAGQGTIPGQGSAAVPLLIAGLILSWLALPGWTELVLMWPNRVGGIAGTCAEAFRPYSPVLANLTGVCYWWGWVPTCGLTALLSASALHEWYLPGLPVSALACGLVLIFTGVNLCGIHWATRFSMLIAAGSGTLAFLSALVPVLTGHVDWQQATTFHLTTPFPGVFGQITSAMAGLYLIGFAAPAFEQAACHVGETFDQNKNVPRAMYASAAMATLYFAILPVVWLGVLGPEPLGKDLALVLGPTFAPLFGSAAKGAAIWFMTLNMFHGTIAPLAGAARTLSQLSEDGLLPRFLAQRDRADAPLAATLLTAGMAIVFLLLGDPLWIVAAANFTYLIGIGMPSIAVWLLRRDAPEMPRPYRASTAMIHLGVLAAVVWGISTILGFQQFGLPTVVAGVCLAYSGSALYGWRKFSDRRRLGLPGFANTIHLKLTGAMLAVLVLDGAGYLIAVQHIRGNQILVEILADIFVLVALLTITVGLVLPGMIGHATMEAAAAAKRLADGPLAAFCEAMDALNRGDLDAARVSVDVAPLAVRSRDELGQMAASFNQIHEEIARAAAGLDVARESLRRSHLELRAANADLEEREERFRQFAENINQVFWMQDPEKKHTLYVSPAYENVWGRSVSSHYAAPLSYLDAIHPEDRDAVIAALPRQQEGSYDEQYRVVHPDGTIRWVQDRAFPVRDHGGAVYRVVGITEDITERKLAHETAEAAREEAERANRAKNEFLSRVSHELRTPLNAILGFGQILEAESTGDERQCAEHILKAGNHLLELVNEVLDLSSIEAGRMIFSPETISLRRLIHESLQLIGPLAERRAIRLASRHPDGDLHVFADHQRVKQVLLNLLSNAVKYNREAGSIDIACTPAGGDRVRVAVRDTGLGLAPEQVALLFTPFQRLGAENTKIEGSGLGLALSKRVTELLGGTIGVESTPGDGSTFWIELPLAGAPDSGIPVRDMGSQAAPEPARRAVLYVEDNLSNLRLVEAILARRPDLHVIPAMQGSIGLDLARQHLPYLVLLDLHLPDMPGHEVMRRLRSDPPTAAIPVIIVSADATPTVIERMLAEGARAYVTKPIDVRNFLTLLDEALGERSDALTGN